MRRIPQQNDVFVPPRLAPHLIKVEPLRLVRQQLAPAQILSKQGFTVGHAGRLVGRVQPCPPPHVLLALHNKGAARAVKRVGVRLEQPMLVFAEVKGKRIQHHVSAKPDVFGRPACNRRLEFIHKSVANFAVHPIGGNDQIVIGENGKILKLSVKGQPYA